VIGEKAVITDPSSATIALVNDAIAAARDASNTRIDAMDKAQALFHDDMTRVPTAVDRQIAQLKELVEARLAVLVAADEASTAQRIILAAEINRAFEHLRALHGEKFSAIEDSIMVFKETVNGRFELGDVQTEKAARDVKSAVDAAFAAAKEAVGEQNKSNALSITKSELAFTKQIDQLGLTVAANGKNTDDKIDAIKKNSDDKLEDLKERIAAMESRTAVSDPATQSALSQVSAMVASLAAARDRGDGAKNQTQDNRAFIATGFGIVVAMIAIFGFLMDFKPH